MNTLVRRRLPPPGIFATANFVLSYRTLWGTPPRKRNADMWPSQNASVVSAGYAFTKIPSLWGRDRTKKMDLALHAGYDGPRLPERGAERGPVDDALEHLADGVSVQAEYPGGPADAHAVYHAGSSDTHIQFHTVHPSHFPSGRVRPYGR